LHPFQIRGNDLEDIAIVAGDVVALEHAGMLSISRMRGSSPT